jgi:hypothetical protein
MMWKTKGKQLEVCRLKFQLNEISKSLGVVDGIKHLRKQFLIHTFIHRARQKPREDLKSNFRSSCLDFHSNSFHISLPRFTVSLSNFSSLVFSRECSKLFLTRSEIHCAKCCIEEKSIMQLERNVLIEKLLKRKN